MTPTIQLNDPKILQLGLEAEIAFCNALSIDQLTSCQGIIAVALDMVDPILNVVVHAQTTNKEIDNKIRIVIDYFKQRQIRWSWLIGPLSRPANLPYYLKKYGLSYLEEFPSLYLSLASPLPVIPEHFAIFEASPEDDLTEWIQPARAAFPNPENAEGYRRANARKPHGPGAAFRHFFAKHHGKTVGCSTLFLAGESCMIQNVGTDPFYRNQGYGTALTVKAMLEAKKLGCKHCFLNSSPIGYRLYQRLGFRTFCLTQMYGFK
jgi:ribosomal protein S18 acetylase RimI-like enzyme